MRETVKEIGYTFRSHFLDIGSPENTIIVAGVGRNGTTLAANVINYDKSYRVLFEPFLPAAVKEAQVFTYNQYLHPQNNNPVLVTHAKKILAGMIRSQWVDQDNNGFFYDRRIVKDIRCNLMLGWLKKLSPQSPIILVIRHPLQVVSSWRNLGWGIEARGSKSVFETITSQKTLLEEFSIIKEGMKRIDIHDFIESTVFLWCVYYLVPLKQLKASDVHALFYERLVMKPEDETEKLFRYLGKPIDKNASSIVNRKGSRTNYQNRDFSKSTIQIIDGWKKEFTADEIKRSRDILSMFGMDDIYGENGLPTDLRHFQPT